MLQFCLINIIFQLNSLKTIIKEWRFLVLVLWGNASKSWKSWNLYWFANCYSLSHQITFVAAGEHNAINSIYIYFKGILICWLYWIMFCIYLNNLQTLNFERKMRKENLNYTIHGMLHCTSVVGKEHNIRTTPILSLNTFTYIFLLAN